jgi:hypothetical protein
MLAGKSRYLNALTSRMRFKSMELNDHIEGSSPPSVFVGKFGYPKVYVGPMMAGERGDTSIMDTPESWIASSKKDDVINFRLQLVRGKYQSRVTDENKMVEMIRDIALAKRSVDLEAEFSKKPRGFNFHEETQPFGPSAPLKTLVVQESKYEPHMEKVYYDTDLLAREAVLWLYDKGLLTSAIQKAFSVGSMGIEKNRKLVPTRWSITAVDTILSEPLIEEIRGFEKISDYRVYEFSSFSNAYYVLMMPVEWQYEFIEAFIHVLGREEIIFSDHESYFGRKDYAQIGGCYYAARLAVTEKLGEMRKQAGVVIFRESYPGYVPLGVWLVREAMRAALSQQPKKFENLDSALNYIYPKLWLPKSKWVEQSNILRNLRIQRRLVDFAK